MIEGKAMQVAAALSRKALMAGAAALLAIVVGTGSAALAQDTAKDAAKAEEGKKSSWVKLCEKAPLKKDDPAKEICISHHERLDPNTGAPIVSAAIRVIEGEAKPRLLVTVPLGMAIPPGVQMKIDDQKEPVALKYTFCLPNGCTAEVDTTPELLAAMEGGKVLTVATINLAAETLGFQVPLNGFKETYSGPPVDTAKFVNARKQLLMRIREKMIERVKAAQEKKKQEGGTAAEGEQKTTTP
jgi:invasion protein IalB